jgi:hypothetical protein
MLSKSRGQGPRSDVPDLRTQWESLLDQVWRSEAQWRMWDRLDAAVLLDTLRERPQARLEAPGTTPGLDVS